MAQRKRYRVIIALRSADECLQMQKRLEQAGACQVLYMTGDGEACIRQVLRDEPDLVLIEDILRDMEGREVLRQLRLRGVTGKLMLLTSSVQVAYGADVRRDADLCVMRPYDPERLPCWMAELAAATAAEPFVSYQRAKEEAAWLLQDMQILPTVEGYAHVCHGVALAVEDPGIMCRGRGERGLYMMLCRQDGEVLPYKTVEHRIRTLGKKIFAKNDKETLKKYFPLSIVERGKIKNRDLIAVLAQHVRAALRDEEAMG